MSDSQKPVVDHFRPAGIRNLGRDPIGVRTGFEGSRRIILCNIRPCLFRFLPTFKTLQYAGCCNRTLALLAYDLLPSCSNAFEGTLPVSSRGM